MPIDANFRLFDLSPMIGDLTANQLGFSTVYSASTPSDYFAHSMDRLNTFLTQRGGQIAQQGRDVIEVMPPGYDPSASMPYPKGQRPPAQQGGDVNVVDDEGVLDKLSKMNPFLMNGGLFEYSKETKVMLYLLVIGVLLFAAGVFSLR